MGSWDEGNDLGYKKGVSCIVRPVTVMAVAVNDGWIMRNYVRGWENGYWSRDKWCRPSHLTKTSSHTKKVRSTMPELLIASIWKAHHLFTVSFLANSSSKLSYFIDILSNSTGTGSQKFVRFWPLAALLRFFSIQLRTPDHKMLRTAQPTRTQINWAKCIGANARITASAFFLISSPPLPLLQQETSSFDAFQAKKIDPFLLRIPPHCHTKYCQ